MDAHRHSPFGDTLRQFRERAGLSQGELAELAGLSLRGISDLERGKRTTPRPETVRMLADALQLGPEDRSRLLGARGNAPDLIPQVTRRFADGIPRPPTSFVGRASEIENAIALLEEADTRFLTLVGPGGVGKTRIAIEVARRLEDKFEGNVVFVDLTSVLAPQLVLPTIARHLNVMPQRDADLDDLLVEALQKRPMLLVIDNMEQVADAAIFISPILARCPLLRVLATSRVVLHIAAEHVMSIEPLPLPPDQEIESLQRADAVTLFVSRAHARDPGFGLTRANAAAVAETVMKLQGMPLAIELAAARIGLFSVDALLQRLEQQLPLLSGGVRDGPARHQTMRDTITWSYNLLTPLEQRVFRALSIFPDGCTLETAIALLSYTDELAEGDVFAAVESLVDSSLLRPRKGVDGQTRYRMLITVQEFGEDELRQHREDINIGVAAYEQWALPLAQSVEFLGIAAIPPEQVRNVTAEYQNLRRHIRWLVDNGFATQALEISGQLAGFRLNRGYMDEGRRELEFLLSLPGNQETTLTRARGVTQMGVIANAQADAMHSYGYLQEGVGLSREVGSLRYEAIAHHVSARAMLVRGDFAAAEESYHACAQVAEMISDPAFVAYAHEGFCTLAGWRDDIELSAFHQQKALEIYEDINHLSGIVDAKMTLGYCYGHMGRIEEGNALILEGASQYSEFDHPGALPGILTVLGAMHFRNGELDEALNMHLRSLELSREMGDMREVAASYSRAAKVLVEQQRYAEADPHYREAITFYLKCGDVQYAVRMIKRFVPIHLAAGNMYRAAWCQAVADRFLAAGGYPPETLVSMNDEDMIAAFISGLGDRTWQELQVLAEAITPDEMFAEVRSWPLSTPVSSAPA